MLMTKLKSKESLASLIDGKVFIINCHGCREVCFPEQEAKELQAELEAEGKLKAVITQNIDGLHQKAGSQEVLELHGSVLRNYCERCHAFYGVEAV